MREVLIPLGNGASTLSAYGIAAGDVTRFTEVETSLRAPFDDQALAREIAAAIGRARQSMVAAGLNDEPVIDAWALMRYSEQLMHSLEVPVGTGEDLAVRFSQEYARRYGQAAASAFQAAEIFALRVRARVPAAVRRVGAAAPAETGQAIRTVPVFWPDAGRHLNTAVYDGSRVATVSGPALIELPHTTIAVPDGATLRAAAGHFRLSLKGSPR